MNKIWRDRVGIEPTEDGTRLPNGFEDQEEHQFLIRPQNDMNFTSISVYMDTQL